MNVHDAGDLYGPFRQLSLDTWWPLVDSGPVTVYLNKSAFSLVALCFLSFLFSLMFCICRLGILLVVWVIKVGIYFARGKRHSSFW